MACRLSVEQRISGLEWPECRPERNEEPFENVPVATAHQIKGRRKKNWYFSSELVFTYHREILFSLLLEYAVIRIWFIATMAESAATKNAERKLKQNGGGKGRQSFKMHQLAGKLRSLFARNTKTKDRYLMAQPFSAHPTSRFLISLWADTRD